MCVQKVAGASSYHWARWCSRHRGRGWWAVQTGMERPASPVDRCSVATVDAVGEEGGDDLWVPKQLEKAYV